MAEPVAHRAGAAPGLWTLTRIARVCVIVAAALLAPVGAVVYPEATLLAAPLVGLWAVGVSVLVHGGRLTTPEARRAAGAAGAGGALALPTISGLALLGDSGAVLLAVLLALVGLWVTGATVHAAPADEAVAARRELATLRRVLADVPAEDLLRESRRATDRLGRDVDPDVRAIVKEMRTLAVDELVRRDSAAAEGRSNHGDGDPWKDVPGGRG